VELRITEIIDVAKIAEPLFVIALNAIVTDLSRGVRYDHLASKLARRSSRVVPHPEAGASILETERSATVRACPENQPGR
jgi:hypothetical protein